ncbi:MAG: HlyD family type I secretion periplasmic adaptor subunit, partial [Desulfobacterales bacterium]|nr:HlyD family type I secretion periplasmic adaptor subunit [Desulfobacterales bacterium]
MSLDKNSVQKVASRRWAGQSRKKYSQKDIRFMNSLSAAVLSDSPARTNILLYAVALVIISLIAWANYAEIDERTQGSGRMIPSQQIQVVQNLEGGIIKEIKVVEGESVKKEQILVVIDNTGAGSSFAESKSVINELRAHVVRFQAEAGIKSFKAGSAEAADLNSGLLVKEKRLYDTNMIRKKSEIGVLKQRLKQRRIELAATRLEIKTLKSSREMMAREIELTQPMFDKRLVSELEFIQLKQKVLDKKHEHESAIKNAESLVSKIRETENQIREIESRHRGEAQEELNKALAEIERLRENQVAIEDRVKRTNVRSPVDGTVKQLLINTVGGVVKPGMDIVEIVPHEKKLLVEAKIRPSDIAFLYPGLKAIVKLTAYDFAIYGGLDGAVVHISADTITDERQEEFYLVRIMTQKNYLG